MRTDFLRGGFPGAAVFRVVVTNVKVKIALWASKVEAAYSTRVDDLPLRVFIETREEGVVDDNTKTSRFLGSGVVV